MDSVLTISDLRRITGQPAHVINHAVSRHGPSPRGRVGIARVWLPEDLPRIVTSIQRTRRQGSQKT